MRRADQLAGLLLLVFGVSYAWVAFERYTYWDPGTGPGSGFLPFWLGVAMTVLAGLLLAGATRRREPGPRWLPDVFGLRRLLAVFGVTVAFVALMKVVGMIAGTAIFLFVVLHLIEQHRWLPSLAIGVATAAATYLIFSYWLRVPFPEGLLGF